MAFVALATLLAVFATRLFELQALDPAGYAKTAATYRLSTVELLAPRGEILDRNGTALARTVDSVRVVADPKLVLDPAGTARRLAPLLAADPKPLARKLRYDGHTRWVSLVSHVPPATWRQISRLDLSGIFSEAHPLRTYPADSVAANVIGFVGADGHGLAGLERTLEDRLVGTNGERVYQRTPMGDVPIATAGERSRQPVPGDSVTLTIDRDLQWYAQRSISTAVAKADAEAGYVVVMVPSTGEVLALATSPSYNPNRPGKSKPADLGNRALSDVYEPGSTAKVLTAAAALEEGVARPGTRLTIPGTLHRSDATFHDHVAHGTWRLTYAGAIAQSSNIGTILVAERLTPSTLAAYLKRFGLGQATGLGLPESRGILAPAKDWSGTQRYTIPFGQGLSVTALQAASVYATIANGGERVRPRLVKGFTGADGRFTPAAAPKRTRVVSSRTARMVTNMLESVVSEEGTAPAAAIPGYRVAGKTGTAERYDERCRGYCGYTASFIGFAPADDPALVVACTIQNPINGRFGGQLCGPVFTEVMKFALATMKVPPTGTKPPALRLTW
ncbi:MAG TPA: penicillin-binding protein 2 [Actinomycetes bacterium]|nr:penicillin-binding protein 2 [Actinomycetes bacterium]